MILRGALCLKTVLGASQCLFQWDAYASFVQFIHSRDCRIYMVSLCQTLLYIQWCRCYVWRMWPKKWLCLWRLGWLEHPPLVLHQWLSNFGLEFLRLFEKSNIMIGSCIVSNFWNVSWNYYSCTGIREVKFSPVNTTFWIKEKRRLHCMVIVENSGRGKRSVHFQESTTSKLLLFGLRVYEPRQLRVITIRYTALD